MRVALWAGVVLLACPAVAEANVAVIYRPGDPGYARARLASQVVHVAAIGAVVTGLAWYLTSRGLNRTGAIAVLFALLCVMFFFWAGSFTVIVPPDEPPPPPSPFGDVGRRPRPGSMSGEEVTVYAAVGSMILAGWGIWAARRSVAPRSRGEEGGASRTPTA